MTMDDNLAGMVQNSAYMVFLYRPVDGKKLSIRQAMLNVGFSQEKATNLSWQMKVRRKVQEIKDSSLPLSCIKLREKDDDEETPSTLSKSPGISKVPGTTTVIDVDNPNTLKKRTLPTQQASTASAASSNKNKKTRRTSHQLQHHHAEENLQKRKDIEAHKEATRRYAKSQGLGQHNPNYVSAQAICDEVNSTYSTTVTGRTIRNAVNEGKVGLSPPKKGPAFLGLPHHIMQALTKAYTTYLKLTQAGGTEATHQKNIVNKIEACLQEGNMLRDPRNFQRHLQKVTSNEFMVGGLNVQEQRRKEWTTFRNLSRWFDTFGNELLRLGFAREKNVEDGNLAEDGSVIITEEQKARIINLDETSITLDGTKSRKGGRPPVVFNAIDISHAASAPANKSSYSCTLICGSCADGQALPPHFQLCTAAQTVETQTINFDCFLKAPGIKGTWGFGQETVKYCTFGCNKKGGMDSAELHKYLTQAIMPLYPDAADVPGKRVLIKIDSGPGRNNEEMLVALRLRGFYLLPGLPNSTHVTQETDQNYGWFKHLYRANLQVLTALCIRFGATLAVSNLVTIVFGGQVKKENTKKRGDFFYLELEEAFDKSFSRISNLKSWLKVGAVPLTRACMYHKDVIHEIVDDEDGTVVIDDEQGAGENKEAAKLRMLEECNHSVCSYLTGIGLGGGHFKAFAPKAKKLE